MFCWIFGEYEAMAMGEVETMIVKLIDKLVRSQKSEGFWLRTEARIGDVTEPFECYRIESVEIIVFVVSYLSYAVLVHNYKGS